MAGWPFGKSRNANAKSAPVGVNLPIVELPNESHQIGRMLEIVILALRYSMPLRSVAAERKNVADARAARSARESR